MKGWYRKRHKLFYSNMILGFIEVEDPGPAEVDWMAQVTVAEDKDNKEARRVARALGWREVPELLFYQKGERIEVAKENLVRIVRVNRQGAVFTKTADLNL